MIDYAFLFADEAAAKAALPAYWFDYGGSDWAWDTSHIMASSQTASSPLHAFMGVDRLDGYLVSLSLPEASESVYAIPQCIVEADRATASFLRTRLDNEQIQAFCAQPVMAGTTYSFPGFGHNFILDDMQHPIGDDADLILEATS